METTRQRWVLARPQRRCSWSADIDDGHHASIFMIKDVAVVYGAPRVTSEVDEHPHSTLGRNIDDVTPNLFADRLPVRLDHLHRPYV